MNLATAIVALAGMATLITLVYVGGPWALLGIGLLALAGAAILGRAQQGALPARPRRRRRSRPRKAAPPKGATDV